jgi:dihydroorotase
MEAGRISIEKVVHKMCHAPAEMFNIDKRGYLKEGYWADIVVVNPNSNYQITADNILYKCGWSPLEGKSFNHSIDYTIVSGHLAYELGKFNETKKGMRLAFDNH